MKNILFTIETTPKIQKQIVNQTKSNIIFKQKRDVTLNDLLNVDAIIGNIKPELVNLAPLKWMHLESAGADQYAKILNPDIVLTNSTGAYGHAIAEHMIAAVYYFYKKLDIYSKAQQNHLWINQGEVDSVEGSTVVIVGYGDIGQSFGQRMKALGCKIIGVKRTDTPAPYADKIVTMDKLEEVVKEADILALALPSTPDTYQCINKQVLTQCKKSALLINVGRGVTIHTDDLCEVLEQGYFKGVMLDVVDPEPLPINHKLWRFDNVLITPHVSGNYNLPQTYTKVINIAIDNINKFENDEQLINLVDRNTGYKKS